MKDLSFEALFPEFEAVLFSLGVAKRLVDDPGVILTEQETEHYDWS